MSSLEFLDRTLAGSVLASDVIFAGEPCGEWRLGRAPTPGPSFHLVLRGSAWLHQPGERARHRLGPGDLAFFPRDAEHVLAATENVPESMDTVLESARPASASSEVALVCGKLRLEPQAHRFLLAPLPELVLMPHGAPDVPSIVPSVVSVMWQEVLENPRPLAITLSRLADVLVAQVLRFSISSGLVAGGVFAGLADTQLGRAILAMLREPQRPWTVESLASAAAMSRSAFAARFLEIVRQTPQEFLRDWRMQLAMQMLRKGRSVAEAAEASGYESEASFAKAFKRVTGVGPGAVRRGLPGRLEEA
jgi:AraC-like DNA-binding protein